jgi:peptidoglycan hydrolase CwlO-like protein
MKLQYSFAALVLALSLAGCDRSDQAGSGASPASPPERETTARDVKREVHETIDTTKQYVADNKDEFVAKVEKKLHDLDARIAELSGKAAPLKEDAKAEADRLMTSLNQKRSELNDQLDGLKQASKEKWAEAKTAFENAFAELEKAYENTKAKFSS